MGWVPGRGPPAPQLGWVLGARTPGSSTGLGPGARTPGSSTGLGPGSEDPQLLNWAAWGMGILTLRMPASHCPGCLWPLWTQSVTIILGGDLSRNTLPRQSGGFLWPRHW